MFQTTNQLISMDNEKTMENYGKPDDPSMVQISSGLQKKSLGPPG